MDQQTAEAAQQVGQASPWWFTALVVPVGAALAGGYKWLVARADAETRARIEELKLQIEKIEGDAQKRIEELKTEYKARIGDLEDRLERKESENRELLKRVAQLEEALRSCPAPGRPVGL